MQQNTLRPDQKNLNRRNPQPTKRPLFADRVPTPQHDSLVARKGNERPIQAGREASKVKLEAEDAARHAYQRAREISHVNQSNDEGERKDVE